jgi:WD40 repeat protein
LAILKGHSLGVNALDFSTFSNLLVSGGKDKKIAMWSIY